jgi:hypothetical protein
MHGVGCHADVKGVAAHMSNARVVIGAVAKHLQRDLYPCFAANPGAVQHSVKVAASPSGRELHRCVLRPKKTFNSYRTA